MVYGLGEE